MFFTLFLLSLLVDLASSQSNEGYEVHVVNVLPNNDSPLKIHCASKTTDLGNHTLYVTNDFYWHFRMNFWHTTMFFCSFHWGSRNQAFEVFNEDIAYTCGFKPDGNICNWSVREDGFWLSNQVPPGPSQIKKYDWVLLEQ
ncbi:S-protein homolog 19-like [Primulina huaijiensis]|uniref:S-protein homolog 19-like n=1 Tax=Primulina huaijiensis TaxID=1492673 RepID=UPI003CC732ED